MELTMVSKKFKIAVKLDSRPQYRLAQLAKVNPTTLSQFLTGYVRPKRNDPRVLRIGEILGLTPDECFGQPATKKPATDAKADDSWGA
jgi:hypothetical protein